MLVTVPSLYPGEEGGVRRLEAAGVSLRFAPCQPSTPIGDLIQHLDGCDAVMAADEAYTFEVLAAASQLKHVARYGAGYDSVDLAAAERLGVVVTNTPGANAEAVADHAFALILALARRVSAYNRAVRAGDWRQHETVDVWGATLGVVGLGHVGRAVATRATRGFAMRVLAYTPRPDRGFAERLGVELVSLEILLGKADFVSLHAAATPEATDLIDARRLALMKPTAFLVNTARGRLVDEDALYQALVTGRIAGAGLDVRRVEPPTDARFDTLDNVIMTPHAASVTRQSRLRSGTMAADAILCVLRGDRPEGLLNPTVWERRRT